ncbi:MAG: 3-deoxy-manno-octulosonate cytidylyltransferase [Bacteroidota bacterium]|nr:3-deoxy-manno-octulosonate cytidylyltransferase [Crocinitomicaceae bacterium]MEC8460411.1 3-deoxy-manno-octulosonate cytidylyltransferase [Bacteroidota bacterium]
MKAERSSILGIIPARFNSTRLKGKPLMKIGDKTMIQHVYENCANVLDHLLVATDDQRILNEVKGFNGNAIMTNKAHISGTDRCLEAIHLWEKNQNKTFSLVFNIQGDEPFVHEDHLHQLISCFEDNKTEIATLAIRVSDLKELREGKVYLVKDNTDFAMYFSRFPIPFNRDMPKEDWIKHTDYYQHIGLYGFKRNVLEKCGLLQVSNLENTEKLEQLRWMENGMKIKVGITNQPSFGVDTLEDLGNARKKYASILN